MRAAHRVQSALLAGTAWGLGALPRGPALATGAALGALVGSTGLRARVARSNLALAFPERDERWRERVLAEHWRELGRVAADYARMPALVRGPRERVFTTFEGEEHVRAAHALGRGVILLTGHLGHFELMGAALGRVAPVTFVVKPLSNPGAERWLDRTRRASGVGTVSIGAGMRAVLRGLRAGGIVAMLADQDARRDGVFVPFMGRLASTPVGPARLALATGAPIVFGTCLREPDGRYRAVVDPPHVAAGSPEDPEAVRALTAWHTARLERTVRERPESWFWLHKRWKTAPPPQET